jgi:uncharacterized protein YbaR (Trm112 family)
MVETKAKKCPICFHALKFLSERNSKLETSKNGKEYWKHYYENRALYCKRCDVVYPLDLQESVDELKNLI